MIDFKTYDEQIEILEKRGMIIAEPSKQYVKDILKQNNYYNVINGYKDIFIQSGITPEKFIAGVTFDEIFSVHQFDKDLRLSLSHLLILVERTFSSVLSHEFSRIHLNHDADYLDINNYNTNTYYNKTAQAYVLYASDLICELNSILYKAISSHNPDKMISHYKNKYNRVPLWVFVNKLTFGTLGKMYKLFQPRERDAIAKSLGKISKQRLYADDVQNALSVLVLLRNKCAHDQRIYDFNPQPTTIKPNIILKKYIPTQQNISTLFGAITATSLFLPQTHFSEFLRQFKKQIKSLFATIHSIPTKLILDKMGVPQTFLTP